MANLLPEDTIFYEILARLPLKSLLRFTLICKRWRSLLRSIDFHIANASYNPPKSPSSLVNWQLNGHFGGFHIVNKDHNNVLIKRIDDSILNSCKRIYDFDKTDFEARGIHYFNLEETVCVIGSVHGLVGFFQTFSYPFFFIWNPLTKMFKKVVSPPRDKSRDPSDDMILIYYKYGFYYDSVDRDFRIISIRRLEKRLELGKEFLILVQVYSCKLDKWREIRDDSLPNSEFYIAGIFESRVYVHFYSKPSVLVAFDVHDEVFKRFPGPQHSGVVYTKHCSYINWQDSLGIVAYKEPNDAEDSYIYDGFTWVKKYNKVVYIYDEASCGWIEKYIAPDALDSHRLLHGLENGDIVVEEKRHLDSYQLFLESAFGESVKDKDSTGIVKLFEGEGSRFINLTKLFEGEGSRFINLTKVSASDLDVKSYTESLVCINGMQPL